MRFQGFYFYVMLCGLWLVGCASPRNTTVSSPSAGYSEDLSIWRPKTDTPVTTPTNSKGSIEPNKTQYIEPKYAVNKQLDTVLDSIDRYNLSRKFIDGFTIQIYSGLKREDALNSKKRLAGSLPDIKSEVEYTQPNFRVKAGQYFNRLDAQRDYIMIKRYFPSSIVIPDKVSIN
ncbi:MAG TPA: hypothetical protein VJ184_14595 [Chryseolinea sp.]|nr:hypothetical protein [Chryseolinea sp.]